MSGIINAQPSGPQQADPSSGLSNPLLAETEAKIEGNIADPQVRADFQKIVVAGLHIALQGGPSSFMAKLRASQDPVGDCARGAAALVLIMRRESKGVMPMKSGIPAGLVLMLHGLDFIDRAKIAQIAEPQLDAATKTYTNEIFHKLGITPAMLQGMMGRVHGIMQDPKAMQAINLKAGVVKSPLIPQPTPLPGATARTS